MAEQLTFSGMPSPGLDGFLRYYGSKRRVAHLYPAPRHHRIVEWFAGGAGYSLAHAHHDVVLVELYPPLARLWRYLITAPSAEIRSIPLVEHADDLPSSLPEGAHLLVRWNFAHAEVTTRVRISQGVIDQRASGRHRNAGWSSVMRERCAAQVERIRHWTLVEADWSDGPIDELATHFVDPPYVGSTAGAKYPKGPKGIDYARLGEACRAAPGQVIACENEGATWLPFRSFRTFHRGLNKAEGSREVIWTSEDEA